MRAEGLSVQQRFKSHDYGMVGFIKQLVDATSVHNISGGDGMIASMTVYASQVFVRRR